jgi:plasmid stabilization system protein ParE
MRLEIAPEAESELEAAFAYYDERSPTAAAGFAQSFFALIEQLRTFPQSAPIVREKYHRALFAGFPWAAFYTIEEDLLLIVQVIHDSRSPESWVERPPDADAEPLQRRGL